METDYILRETTGTPGLEQTVRAAISILAENDIPHLIAGGLAVQDYGYFRVALDANIIVPDIISALAILTNDRGTLFEPFRRLHDTVRNRRNGVLVNFLPGGFFYQNGCRVRFPMPTEVTDLPSFISLADLISLKLDSWANNPGGRLKDRADVIELIRVSKLPRDFPLQEVVRALYIQTWNAANAGS